MNTGNKNNSQAGAEMCLKAIRQMERMSALSGPDYLQEREIMVSTLINAAEPLSPFMTGFISALAEYIDLSLGCNPPVATYWKPTLISSDALENNQESILAI